MSSASDSFTRADNLSLGPNWTYVNPTGVNPVNSQIISNAVAAGPGPFLCYSASFAAYNAVVPQTPDQVITSQISAVAPPTSVLSITAVTANSPIAGQATYAYTLSSGAALVQPQEIIITGMQNAANNQTYSLTVSVTGSTFVIANAGAISESGSTGTGLTPTDCILGNCVRLSGDGLNSYFQLWGNNSAYFAGGTDNRQWVHEVWKDISGTGTSLVPISAGVPDSVNDLYTLLAAGKKIATFKNGLFFSSVDDTSIAAPGYFGFTSQAANVSGHSAPLSGQTVPSVTGTRWKNWTARDIGTLNPNGAWAKQAQESFNAAPNYAGNWTVQGAFANQMTFNNAGGSTGGVGTGSAAGQNSGIWTGRAWANNQASSIVIYRMFGNTAAYCFVRANTLASYTLYFLQIISTSGSGTTIGAGTFSVVRAVAASQTVLKPSTAITINSLDCFRLEAQGTTITAYQNSNVLFTTTDSGIASGSPGMMLNSTFNSATEASVVYWSGDELATAFTIGGSTAGLSGVTVTYIGPSSGSVTSDALGYYSIPGLAAGSYTITPSKTGVTFSPAAAIVPVSSANVTENFATGGGGGGDLGPGFDLKLRL